LLYRGRFISIEASFVPKTQPIEIIYSASILSKLRHDKLHAAVKGMGANTKEQEETQKKNKQVPG